MNKQIHVAAAIIYRNGQFLLSKRQSHQHQGGKWEFPGGKVESGETVQQALIRELKEEINIEVTTTSPFHSLKFDYPEKTVKLDFLLVSEFDGEEAGLEGQEVSWFDKSELLALTFPDANVPVLAKIRDELK
ncbi:8-oxo-dGTP diphosphatase MutT [Psychrosphaera sp. 1_MG-2023]|uniref:8-oxo-dGTP diphosphatase MutT n=1 Tax=Psychrosphaera sp. 1_MG-2023 TaxID=3062643 RepID=UPI0026E471E3|nr:8-oxo-dGTP diphosphatase MutT [Psychrosphaera sp. 1_MG-2023]MDO6719226.1 8-oxo-dGTP diphosphatase MutT [Psychrosphaera sp. 1_MG-2023]